MTDLRAARSLEFFTTPRNSPSFPLSECYLGMLGKRKNERQQRGSSRQAAERTNGIVECLQLVYM